MTVIEVGLIAGLAAVFIVMLCSGLWGFLSIKLITWREKRRSKKYNRK